MGVEKAIWTVYMSNPCRLYSMRELSLQLKKSYPLIHQHMKRLLKDKKFLSKTVGKSVLCYPNYQHPYTLLKLAESEYDHVQSQEDSLVASLFSFFTAHGVKGVLSSWITNEHLVCVVVDEDSKNALLDLTSKTTLRKKPLFIKASQLEEHIPLLIKKEYILHGFEFFHAQIKQFYREYASYSNVVVEDE